MYELVKQSISNIFSNLTNQNGRLNVSDEFFPPFCGFGIKKPIDKISLHLKNTKFVKYDSEFVISDPKNAYVLIYIKKPYFEKKNWQSWD